MRYTISFPLATAFAALTSCPALAAPPSVVTDMPPVQSLVAQVMGDLGTPVLLLERGASPHGFQLRPSQATAIANADLIFWTGPELAPWLDHMLDNGATRATALSLLAVPGTHLQPFALAGEGADAPAATPDAAPDATPDATEEAGHGAETAGDHDEPSSGTDPHAWLDPGNATLWLGVIAGELARRDPDNAATYRANAILAQTDLAALDARLAAALAPARDKPIVVFHDAYGYFIDHYGLALAGSVSLGDAASPGALRLSALRATVTSGTPICIFPDAQFDPALVAQMADASDIRIGAPLDPEGSTLEPGPALYAALLTNLANSIADCLAAP